MQLSSLTRSLTWQGACMIWLNAHGLSCWWSGKHGQTVNVCVTPSTILPLKCIDSETKETKESQLNGQAPHSQRPGAQPGPFGIERKQNKCIPFISSYYLVSSPNVERKTRKPHNWTGWKAVERECQSTALGLVVGSVVEGFVPKNRGQKVDIIGHFGEAGFVAPKWRGKPK